MPDICERTFRSWFDFYYKDTSLSPHCTDMCDRCSEYEMKEESLKQKIVLYQVWFELKIK